MGVHRSFLFCLKCQQVPTFVLKQASNMPNTFEATVYCACPNAHVETIDVSVAGIFSASSLNELARATCWALESQWVDAPKNPCQELDRAREL